MTTRMTTKKYDHTRGIKLRKQVVQYFVTEEEFATDFAVYESVEDRLKSASKQDGANGYPLVTYDTVSAPGFDASVAFKNLAYIFGDGGPR